MNIKTLPVSVARDMLFNNAHPVTAWRAYYHLSQKELADLMQCSLYDVQKIENSNLHLHEQWLNKIAGIFRVHTDAITIRYNPFNNLNYGAYHA